MLNTDTGDQLKHSYKQNNKYCEYTCAMVGQS